MNQSLSQFGSRYSVFFPPPLSPLSPMGTYPPPSNLNIPVINYTMISNCGFNPIGHGVSTKMIHTGKFNLNNQLSKSESNIFWAGSKAGAHVWGVSYKQLWYQLFVTVCDHISASLSLVSWTIKIQSSDYGSIIIRSIQNMVQYNMVQYNQGCSKKSNMSD